MIAFLDVHYRDKRARAACLLVREWDDAEPAAAFTADIEHVQPYEPGRFYLRELPCLQAVLADLPFKPDLLVVDGYVWLGAEREPGLGARLHEAAGAIPVVGVAKSLFKGMAGCDLMRPVHRGRSKHPLYVTAIGIDLEAAAADVASMHGAHRIPEIVRLADALSRSSMPARS